MIRKISIKNFKSINDLSIELGAINVFIGENGAGKSNILESFAFASAAIGGHLENGQLALRGVRVSTPAYYRSGFNTENIDQNINIKIDSDDNSLDIDLQNDNQPFSKWKANISNSEVSLKDKTNADLKNNVDRYFHESINAAVIKDLIITSSLGTQVINTNMVDALAMELMVKLYKSNPVKTALESFNFSDFIIYSPENYFLRNYNIEEPFIDPLGHRGEGLLKLIKVIKKEKPEQYAEIIENLHLIDWLDKFEITENNSNDDSAFKLTDKYLEDGISSFDIRSANEGFLYLLSYLTLFISDYTPRIFAIENIDTALNPKLCTKLITVLSKLAIKHKKQVVITTHNPAILDGMDLNNEEEKLYIITRGIDGNTMATRIKKKAPLEGESSLKLSEQFLRGYIGGLPKNMQAIPA